MKLLFTVLCYAFGIGLQFYFFFRSVPGFNWKMLGRVSWVLVLPAILFYGLCFILAGGSGDDLLYVGPTFLAVASLMAVVVVAGGFQSSILPVIGVGPVLSLTLVLWLAFLEKTVSFKTWDFVLLAFSVLASIGLLALVLFRIRPDFLGKLALCTWYLFCVFYACYFQVSDGNLVLLPRPEEVTRFGQTGPLAGFFSGMSLVYFSTAIFFLVLSSFSFLNLVFKGSRRSWAKGARKWEEAETLVHRFSEEPLALRNAVIIGLFQGGLYLLNSRYRFLSVSLMINLSLVVLPYFFLFFFRFAGESEKPPVR